MARIRITQKELTTQTGESLLRLLLEITHDGQLSEDEVLTLQDWIERNAPELPAAGYLRQILDAILHDRKVTLQDRWDLLKAIEKVQPTAERDAFRVRTRNTTEPATERQLQFLQVLGVSHPEDLGKWQASELIDAALDQRDGKRARERDSAEPAVHGRQLVVELRAAEEPKTTGAYLLWLIVLFGAIGWYVASLISR